MVNVGTMGTTLRPLGDRADHPGTGAYRTSWSDPERRDGYGYRGDFRGEFRDNEVADYDDYESDRDDDYDDYESDRDDDYDESEYEADYDELAWPRDSRWRPAVAILGAVVAVGAVATAVIVNSGDSASTKATLGAPVPPPLTSSTTTPKATLPSSAAPKASAPQLPPETVTTLTPPSAAPGTPLTPTAAPPLAPTAAPPTVELNPRTVVYSVTGSKQLLDLVNVTYTDARGYPQTEFNVSLPWSRMIVLNPDVQTVSVIASSFYARLNCSVVNAAGQTVVASANNGNLATCTR